MFAVVDGPDGVLGCQCGAVKGSSGQMPVGKGSVLVPIERVVLDMDEDWPGA